MLDQGGGAIDWDDSMESTIVANQKAVGGSRAHLTGTVRIGAPDSFGSHFLASRLVKFVERYPIPSCARYCATRSRFRARSGLLMRACAVQRAVNISVVPALSRDPYPQAAVAFAG
jgi:hypothetical protein